VPYRLSGWRRIPMATSCTCLTDRGLTARPASNCHRWISWRSWPQSCPCRVSTSSAMPAVERRIARCERRSSRRRASRMWTGRRRRLGRLPRAEPGCWGACLIWIWPRVFRHYVGGGKRARPCDLPLCRRGALRLIAASPRSR
jgi:hypothetical protein